MQIKRIICPKCRAILDVKNSKNEEVKQIVCPSCKALLQVRFKTQQELIEAPTYIPPIQQPANNGATQLVGNNNAATQLGNTSCDSEKIAQLFFNGVSYKLEEGQNIVGRKGKTSKATVQIATEDRYMSRQHCCITVTTLPDSTKKVVLSNYQNKNLTTIDGQEIEKGDTIRLVNGNQITMGHTTVTFNLS